MRTVIIPAAGLGSRFRDAGYDVPKPLIPILDLDTGLGSRMIRKVMSSFGEARFLVGVRPEDLAAFEMVDLENCELVPVPRWSEGQLVSILTILSHRIRSTFWDEPAFISNSDVYHDLDVEMFQDVAKVSDPSFAAAVFQSSESCYSYVDRAPLFDLAVEKKVISSYALSGLYWTSSVRSLHRDLTSAFLNREIAGSEMYFSQGFQTILGKKLAIQISADKIDDLGTPEKLRSAKHAGVL